MNELTKFNFSGMAVRVVSIYGEPWWCAKDVCDVLGYVNAPSAVARNCKEKGIAKCDTLTDGGVQSLSYINEPNLFRLISHCHLPIGERFESWIYDEILPQIRKTGTYGVQLPSDPHDQVLMLCEKLTSMTLEAKELQRQIETQRPKVELHDKIISAQNLLSMNEVAKEIGTGRKRLFELLRQKQILMKNNLPYQEYIDRGYFEVKARPLTMGDRTENYSQTFVTAKGLEYISNIMPDSMIAVSKSEAIVND